MEVYNIKSDDNFYTGLFLLLQIKYSNYSYDPKIGFTVKIDSFAPNDYICKFTRKNNIETRRLIITIYRKYLSVVNVGTGGTFLLHFVALCSEIIQI